VLHGAAAAVIGPALTAFLGGVLVLVLVAGAVAVAPAFWRYRVGEPEPPG
jgi:thiol:disulfide interchange protein